MEDILSKEEILLESLLRFYNKDSQYLNILTAISKQKTIISLREMDYTVTNYSHNNKIQYKLKDGTTFNMYSSYKCQLDGYSKKFFDPFCRRSRIFLDFDTKTPINLNDDEIETYKQRDDGIVTTIGQLCFFKWAILNEVIDFCFKNKVKIDEEMEKIEYSKKNKKELGNEINKLKPTKENSNIKLIVKF